jgi:hypothetical protein
MHREALAEALQTFTLKAAAPACLSMLLPGRALRLRCTDPLFSDLCQHLTDAHRR